MIDTSCLNKPMEVFVSTTGRKFRVVEAINVGFSAYPYVVRVADRPAPICFNENGDDFTGTYQLRTLPPVKVERKGWFNHYPIKSYGPFKTEALARRARTEYDVEALATTEVDLSFVEGDGV